MRELAEPLLTQARHEELALLQRRWQQAETGEGSIVLVSGEPGMDRFDLNEAIRNAIILTRGEVDGLEFVEPFFGGVLAPEPGRPFELRDRRVKRAVPVVR
jgi:hypothetical protein